MNDVIAEYPEQDRFPLLDDGSVTADFVFVGQEGKAPLKRDHLDDVVEILPRLGGLCSADEPGPFDLTLIGLEDRGAFTVGEPNKADQQNDEQNLHSVFQFPTGRQEQRCEERCNPEAQHDKDDSQHRGGIAAGS